MSNGLKVNLSADGTSDGQLQVADTALFPVGTQVLLGKSGKNEQRLHISAVADGTHLSVKKMDGVVPDCSAYTVAAGAFLVKP